MGHCQLVMHAVCSVHFCLSVIRRFVLHSSWSLVLLLHAGDRVASQDPAVTGRAGTGQASDKHRLGTNSQPQTCVKVRVTHRRLASRAKRLHLGLFASERILTMTSQNCTVDKEGCATGNCGSMSNVVGTEITTVARGCPEPFRHGFVSFPHFHAAMSVISVESETFGLFLGLFSLRVADPRPASQRHRLWSMNKN